LVKLNSVLNTISSPSKKANSSPTSHPSKRSKRSIVSSTSTTLVARLSERMRAKASHSRSPSCHDHTRSHTLPIVQSFNSVYCTTHCWTAHP
jgi:hypothetical protein